MHNIFDLKEMEVENLRSLASELQIKGFKRLDKDGLVYAILDREAELNAKNAPATEPKAKKGRPKKAAKPAEVNAEAAPQPAKQAEAPQAKPEKKQESKPEQKPEPVVVLGDHTWGVIGSFNGWAADEVMTFDPVNQIFYADVEFTEDGQFKLRADADWAVNWGAEAFGMTVSNSDGNLEAKAGKYRIYADMNNPAGMTIELNAKAYGTEVETPEPEPEPEPDPTPDPIRIYLSTAWGWPYIWCWDSNGAQIFAGASWPGTKYHGEENGYYYWDVPAEYVGKTVSLLAVKGDKSEQTSDFNNVVLDKSVYFYLEWTSEKGCHLIQENK